MRTTGVPVKKLASRAAPAAKSESSSAGTHRRIRAPVTAAAAALMTARSSQALGVVGIGSSLPELGEERMKSR
jgi:hypothetical protein